LSYVGDDFVLLGMRPTPIVYSLYNSAKLNADHLQRFPYLAPFVSNRERLETEKALIFLHEHYPEKILRQLPVRALLLPRVVDATDTRLRQTNAAEGLTALAASSIFLLRGAGDNDFQMMAEFVGRVPTYVLELGTELQQIPRVISELLSR
jgi:hypothetical protein